MVLPLRKPPQKDLLNPGIIPLQISADLSNYMNNYGDVDYQSQLKAKLENTLSEFYDLGVTNIEVFDSPPTGFRMRTEFKIWHEDGAVNYAMFKPGGNRSHYIVSEFPIAHSSIQALMPKLMARLNENQTLKQKVFQVEFLSTTTNDTLISLIYHRPLDNEWELAATNLSKELNVSIIGRSKGQKIVIGKDHVFETFNVDNKIYRYQQIENAFTQPNAIICEKMLNWAVKQSKNANGDLLELYCGNGNFTIPLAANFNKVMATEISKPSTHSAILNCQFNQVENIEFLRMSSEEFTDAINATREFRRLKDVDLSSYQFSTVFVDPPRAGLDQGTRQLTQRFDNILYVSCNPDTLRRDIQAISATHKINAMALFDQFPQTPHRECGVVLTRR